MNNPYKNNKMAQVGQVTFFTGDNPKDGERQQRGLLRPPQIVINTWNEKLQMAISSLSS